MTDIARTQDILREKLNDMEDALKKTMSPNLAHLIHILDPRELDNDIRNASSNVIKYGKMTKIAIMSHFN